MNPTRRNFLQAVAVFCMAPVVMFRDKSLPESFVLDGTGTFHEYVAARNSIGCVNENWFCGYPPETILFCNASWERDFDVPLLTEWMFRFTHHFTRITQSNCYDPVDFNQIDFGEEIEG